jgi:hypothetical protein
MKGLDSLAVVAVGVTALMGSANPVNVVMMKTAVRALPVTPKATCVARLAI